MEFRRLSQLEFDRSKSLFLLTAQRIKHIGKMNVDQSEYGTTQRWHAETSVTTGNFHNPSLSLSAITPSVSRKSTLNNGELT